MLNSDNEEKSPSAEANKREMPAAAKRALKEAAARRALAQKPQIIPKETGGRDGPEPVRFGDWEVKGIASDF